ncbi:hypothetical protein [Embleya sp. NPDC001921]
MPRALRLRGTLSGNEQIVESGVTGKLPETTPEDNTDRTVYTYRIGTATTAPATPASGGTLATPAPPAKGRELADTGADDTTPPRSPPEPVSWSSPEPEASSSPATAAAPTSRNHTPPEGSHGTDPLAQ